MKAIVLTEGNRRVTIKFERDYNEFTCRLFVDGKHYEPADYFTDDREDAIGTANEMLRDPAEVQRISKLIADRVDGYDRDDIGQSSDY